MQKAFDTFNRGKHARTHAHKFIGNKQREQWRIGKGNIVPIALRYAPSASVNSEHPPSANISTAEGKVNQRCLLPNSYYKQQPTASAERGAVREPCTDARGGRGGGEDWLK